MRAVDLRADAGPASRMDVALGFAGDFIERREGDRIAIVAFGGRAVTQCPLTFDRAVARHLLRQVRAEMLGKRTALGDGVALGVARLPHGGALVLVSDGQNTAGTVSPTDATRAAIERSVRIYAIGIGTDGPVPVPVRLPSGGVRMEMKDYPLDEAALRQMAETTGGRCFRAADADVLCEAFRSIDRLEARPLDAVRPLPRARTARHATLVAAAALACGIILSSVFLRTAPRLR
jgi:Ca-activated chloride channel family protein